MSLPGKENDLSEYQSAICFQNLLTHSGTDTYTRGRIVWIVFSKFLEIVERDSNRSLLLDRNMLFFTIWLQLSYYVPNSLKFLDTEGSSVFYRLVSVFSGFEITAASWTVLESTNLENCIWLASQFVNPSHTSNLPALSPVAPLACLQELWTQMLLCTRFIRYLSHLVQLSARAGSVIKAVLKQGNSVEKSCLPNSDYWSCLWNFIAVMTWKEDCISTKGLVYTFLNFIRAAFAAW